jgi:hypothetical protein
MRAPEVDRPKLADVVKSVEHPRGRLHDRSVLSRVVRRARKGFEKVLREAQAYGLVFREPRPARDFVKNRFQRGEFVRLECAVVLGVPDHSLPLSDWGESSLANHDGARINCRPCSKHTPISCNVESCSNFVAIRTVSYRNNCIPATRAKGAPQEETCAMTTATEHCRKERFALKLTQTGITYTRRHRILLAELWLPRISLLRPERTFLSKIATYIRSASALWSLNML